MQKVSKIDELSVSLRSLHEMGYTDFERNMKALNESSFRIETAISKLAEEE